MARLWSCGFELQSATALMEWDTATGSPTINTTAGQVRSGSASLRNNLVATTAVLTQQFKAAGVAGSTYVRFYLYIATAPSATARIIRLRQGTGADLGGIRVTTSRTLLLWDEQTNLQVGVASAALALNTWHMIEFGHTGTGDTITGRLNGVQFATGASSSAVQAPYELYFGVSNALTTDMYFDDVAVNDSTGSFQNTWPGEGSIIHLRPNAAGDATGGTRGGTDSGTNWGQVDEAPPNDATDYVIPSITSTIDEYNLAASGLTGTPTINVVSVGWRYAAASATSPDSMMLRVKASAGGTLEESAAITANAITWKTHANAVPRVYPLTLYDLPGASTTAWSVADLDAAQIGFRVSTASVNRVWVSAMWMLVDYVPGAGGTPTPPPKPMRLLRQAVNRANNY